MASEDLRAQTPGEKALLAGLSSGETVAIGGTERPSADAGPDRQIRADFLRAVLLKKLDSAPLHEHGVRIIGARITGALDLEGCTLKHDFAALACHFDATPVLRSARVQNLFLSRSFMPGMEADHLDARGNVFLRSVVAEGEVRLLGASLGGDFDCMGAQFTAGEGGNALSADGLDAKGGVLLDTAVVEGEVRLLGASLGGDLTCNGAQLAAGEGGTALTADKLDVTGSVFLHGVVAEGEVRLLGAALRGDLSCTGAQVSAKPGGRALDLQGIRVEGAFLLREAAKIVGPLDLTGAEIGHICDEEASWPGPGDLFLNRCRYGAFIGKDIDAKSRIRWLGLQDPTRFDHDFWPQPWEQCAKVLREMGHRDDARAVLIDKERRQRPVLRARLRKDLLFEDAYWHAVWDWLLDKTVRFGHQPLRAFLWLAVMLVIGTFVFAEAQVLGAIKPNQPVVLRGDEWVSCNTTHPDDTKARLACFLASPKAASYPRFQPFVYAADTLLPIVDLEMQGYWIPDDTAGRFGAFARLFLWTEIALGWALSLLAVAGFSGLIRTDGK